MAISNLKLKLSLVLAVLLNLFEFAVANQAESKQAQPIKTFKFFIFTPQCYETFFDHFNFFDLGCLKMTVAKLLGYCIITGAAIVKLPQIIKIIQKKTAFGVSFSSITFELLTQILAVTYSIHRKNPFSVYGESVLIVIQMFIIVLLFMIYDSSNKAMYISVFIGLIGLSWAAVNPSLFPVEIIENSIILQMILIIIARFAQIIYVHRVKSTGSLALITCALTVIGNLARVATVLVEVDDFKFLLSFLIATTLNSYILFLFYLYGDKAKPKKQ